MATNARVLRRPSDHKMFFAAAVVFPLLILIGYFKSYYFSAFFDVPAAANSLVHLHGVLMSLWVIYFAAQIALIRTKNFKLHMTLGMFGAALAALVVVSGLALAYDAHVVRLKAPPGLNPHGFFLVGVVDMLLFIIFLGGALYFRKRPAEHKTLMLMTAINFLPAAFARIHLVPEKFSILWAWGMPDLLAVICFVWFSIKHRKFNKIFALAILLLIASQPFRIVFAGSEIWLKFVAWIAP